MLEKKEWGKKEKKQKERADKCVCGKITVHHKTINLAWNQRDGGKRDRDAGGMGNLTTEEYGRRDANMDDCYQRRS